MITSIIEAKMRNPIQNNHPLWWAPDVSQSEGLGRTNNHNQHNKGLRKGEWWCASAVPEGKLLMGKGMLLHQRDDADADRGHS